MADGRITDVSDGATLTSGSVIQSSEHNTWRTAVRDAVNAANDVLADLENAYSGATEPTSAPDGKLWYDTGEKLHFARQDSSWNLVASDGMTTAFAFGDGLTVDSNFAVSGAATITGKFTSGGITVPAGDADFTFKNLAIEVSGDSTAALSADRLSFLNSDNIAIFQSDVDEDFDFETDLMAGTAEKASTWYQLWVSIASVTGAVTRMMVPDISGTATGDTANKLVDTAAAFETDLVQVGDELYNLDDNTKGYVGAVDDENTISCVGATGAALDLFPDGDEDYVIHLLSPTGLGAFKANIGAVYNDAASDLDVMIQTNKECVIGSPVLVASAVSDTTYASRDLSTAIPANAKKVYGYILIFRENVSTLSHYISTLSDGTGEVILSIEATDSGTDPIQARLYFMINIKYAQTLYSKISGNSSSATQSITISGYTI